MRRNRAAILTGIAGVVAGILVFVGILALVGSGKAKSHLGSDVFKVGKAENQAVIVERNGPLLFADPLEKGRDIYVNHLGGTQWAAFDVHPPGEPKSCTVKWQAASHTFPDTCSGRTYPADGTGLVRYSATVDKSGDLVVDLRRSLGP